MKKVILLILLIVFSSSLAAGTIATYKIKNKTYTFTDSDLEFYLKDIPLQFRTFIIKDKKRFAKDILLQKLAAIEAKKLGINKRPEVIKEIKAQNEKILSRYFFKLKSEKYKIKEDELKRYYENHKDQFTHKPGYKFGKIKFAKFDDAVKAFNEIKKKKNFEEYEGFDESNPIAKLIKNRYESRDKLPAKLVKILDSLKIGEISSPFEYNGKFFIVKLRDKRTGKTEPFEKVKEKIKNILKQKNKKLYEEKLKKSLIKKYKVEMK